MKKIIFSVLFALISLSACGQYYNWRRGWNDLDPYGAGLYKTSTRHFKSDALVQKSLVNVLVYKVDARWIYVQNNRDNIEVTFMGETTVIDKTPVPYTKVWKAKVNGEMRTFTIAKSGKLIFGSYHINGIAKERYRFK